MEDFIDFMTSGGDELLNSRQCPDCKSWFNLDEAELVSPEKGLVACPHCGKTVSSD